MNFKIFVVSRNPIPPLPKGAGRGEGEAHKQTAHDRRRTPRRFPIFSYFILHTSYLLLLALPALAFPPAPNGFIYGMVKDQYGTPLLVTSDEVILQTPAGVQVATTIQPGLAIGVNYFMSVPMDMGSTPTPYVANALVAGASFKLYVSVGTVTNLPLEMTSASAVLGASTAITRQDLTLGVDANGDGIPDAWENEFIHELRLNVTLAQLNPAKNYTGDGRTLKQEYLLGNYPFNPVDDFSVQIISQSGGSAVIAFNSMQGRSYTAYGSADLQNWTSLSFSIPANGTGTMSSYYSPNIIPLQIQTVQPTNAPTMQFFKLLLQ